jgi:predicted nucleic acid binding AN1-type Zn finger protein
MEFPNTGTRCAVKECRQLDFLPFTCNHCSNIFCKKHFHIISHSCLKFIKNIAIQTRSAAFFCSQELCKDRSSIEILCSKCNKHFCLAHRTHGCFEQNRETYFNALEKWEKPKQNFLVTKTAVEQEISSKLQKSKNSVMATKVK